MVALVQAEQDLLTMDTEVEAVVIPEAVEDHGAPQETAAAAALSTPAPIKSTKAESTKVTEV